MPWRRFCKTSWRRLEKVLKTSWQDVLKTSWRHLENILKTSWRRMTKTNILVLTRTSWRRLENVFWRGKAKANILVLIKTSSRRLQDVFCRRRWKTSSRRLQDVLIITNVCWVVVKILNGESKIKSTLANGLVGSNLSHQVLHYSSPLIRKIKSSNWIPKESELKIN